MGNKLPKNWVETKLGFIGYIETGNTPSKNVPSYYGNEIPWVKPGDINKASILLDSEEYLSIEGGKKARLIPENSIMVTCIGNLGNVAIAGKEMATNQQINSIVIWHDLINKKYVYYYVLTLKRWLNDNATSTTISMVNKSKFERAPFFLPPLPEQERIATKLDSLFEQYDTLKTSLDRIPQLLKNFRQQVLTMAVAGKFTEECDNAYGTECWTNDIIENLSTKVGSGATPRGGNSAYLNEGIPLIRSMNVHFGGIIYDGIVYLNDSQAHDLRSVEVNTNDVLLNITGASIGRVCIAPADLKGARVNQHVCIIRCNERILPEFLEVYLSSPQIQKYIAEENYGVTRQALTKGQILNLNVKLPTIGEQKEIVRQVESLFEKADRIEQQYKVFKIKIEKLPQAVLHKAFKGELVEQLPTDGNAADLLREIEELNNKLPKSKKK